MGKIKKKHLLIIGIIIILLIISVLSYLNNKTVDKGMEGGPVMDPVIGNYLN